MTKPKKKQPLGQTIGGILFGFDQQVLRTMPPAQELVHHARPDDPLPAGDGGFVTITMPDHEEPVLHDGEPALTSEPGRPPSEAGQAPSGAAPEPGAAEP